MSDQLTIYNTSWMIGYGSGGFLVVIFVGACDKSVQGSTLAPILFITEVRWSDGAHSHQVCNGPRLGTGY